MSHSIGNYKTIILEKQDPHGIQGGMTLEQLNLFGEIDDREVRRTVARELKQFKALKTAMKNKQELEEEGVDKLFPYLGNNEKEKLIKFNQINRAMEEALDEIERSIIEKKYLGSTRVKDISVYMEMGLTKDQYYIYKKAAIAQIATALRII